jgi:hypothetical protein
MEELASLISPLLTFSLPSAIIEDQKVTNTAGGGFTSGSWQTRVLNTVAADPSGIIVGLATNQITLGAGTYLLSASAPGFNVGLHKTRIQNITDAVTLGTGQNKTDASGALDEVDNSSPVFAMGAFSGNTVIELQHRCSLTNAVNGFGIATNFAGSVEVYSQLQIIKVA